MELDLVFPRETGPGEEEADLVALVTLELDDLAVLRVLHYRTIARKVLFTEFYNFLLVKFCSDSLYRR